MSTDAPKSAPRTAGIRTPSCGAPYPKLPGPNPPRTSGRSSVLLSVVFDSTRRSLRRRRQAHHGLASWARAGRSTGHRRGTRGSGRAAHGSAAAEEDRRGRIGGGAFQGSMVDEGTPPLHRRHRVFKGPRCDGAGSLRRRQPRIRPTERRYKARKRVAAPGPPPLLVRNSRTNDTADPMIIWERCAFRSLASRGEVTLRTD